MRIIRHPHAMRGAKRLFFRRNIVPSRLNDNLYGTAAFAVITIHNPFAKRLRDRRRNRFLHIYYVGNLLLCLQKTNCTRFYFLIIRSGCLQPSPVKINLIIFQTGDSLLYPKLCLDECIKRSLRLIESPSAGRNFMVLQETDVMRRGMVGSKEEHVITLAHLLIQISKEGLHILIQPQISIFRLYGIHAKLMSYIIG